MQIAVLAGPDQKEEWKQKKTRDEAEILWSGSLRTFLATDAEVYVDLEFQFDRERIAQYGMRAGRLILVNETIHTCREMGEGLVRINAWPGFLQREICEVAAPAEKEKELEGFFQTMGWLYRLAPDIPGMISARVIASIINEAFYTLGSGTSSREDIDIAMKLGTNYPFGPFEWFEKTGPLRIYDLLRKMNFTDARYEVAPAMEKEMRDRGLIP